MQSKAKTVQGYLDQLPDDRKQVIMAMRKAILKNIPKGFEEVMNYGMIGYVVPHTIYAKGYHATPELPLPFINLASQKNHIALYHMALQGELLEWFTDRWNETTKKKLDKGGACVRFKKPEDVPIALIGELASKVTPQQWIKIYEKARETTATKKEKKK
ncbi:MAG TPA: DUF1801 domain-containing protein [Cyclobacteriaceae bacterium]|jgi:hypothetical protein|nr:DUF1801 domain-containing protein [Cyclobacteriaceae bacterium]